MSFIRKPIPNPATSVEQRAAEAIPHLETRWNSSGLDVAQMAVSASDYDRVNPFPAPVFWAAVNALLVEQKAPVKIVPGGCKDGGDLAYMVAADPAPCLGPEPEPKTLGLVQHPAQPGAIYLSTRVSFQLTEYGCILWDAVHGSVLPYNPGLGVYPTRQQPSRPNRTKTALLWELFAALGPGLRTGEAECLVDNAFTLVLTPTRRSGAS